MTVPKDKLKLALVILLLVVAIFFRFWQIKAYVVFLGDEGRDMIVMRDIFVNKHLPFLGPTASVGGFYLGPVYYWMAAPFLLLANFDPVGPSYFVAALGVATVFLLYKFLKEEIGFWPAITSSFLYATAPLIVRYSRSSWNPNPLPFFSLLMIYSLYLAIKKQKLILGPQSTSWWTRTASYAYYFLAGACLGVAIQLHYLAIILAPLSALIVIINANFKKILKIIPVALLGFTITFSPFLVFEIVHNFPNFRTILEFVARGSTVGYKTFNLIWLVSDSARTFFSQIAKIPSTPIAEFVFWFLTIPVIWYSSILWKEKKLIFSIILIWFLGGLALIRLYTGAIYDYYFEFMFPAPFMLAGIAIYIFWQNFYSRVVAIVLALAILFFFIGNGFYRKAPNHIIDQTSQLSDFVVEKTQGNPFNFALITKSNSDHGYRYFLELRGYAPKPLEEIVTDQLMVVCEDQKCEPLGNSLWEVAGFGRAEIAQQWDFPNYGIKIFRLEHWSGAPSPAGKPAVKGS